MTFIPIVSSFLQGCSTTNTLFLFSVLQSSSIQTLVKTFLLQQTNEKKGQLIKDFKCCTVQYSQEHQVGLT